MLTVRRAPAYATVQDAGRPGFLASGVPRAGAMDLPALHTLNAMLGNDAGCAAIEWALSGGELEFEKSTTFAVAGAVVGLELSGRAILQWSAHRAAPGDTLAISAPHEGRFAYLAVAGGIDVPLVMRSRSTYLPVELGGNAGRRLRAGDKLVIGEPAKRQRHQVSDQLAAYLRPPLASRDVRYVPRDNAELQSELIVSSASDRTGYRLQSQAGVPGGTTVSEPVCPGVIQLPPDGQPIVLMADAPTIGGYRIAGTVISADLGVFAQRAPGERVGFRAVTVHEAQKILAAADDRLDEVREWSLA